MKRRNFLASLGLVAGVTAVAKADKQSYIPLNADGVEYLNLSKDGDELIIKTQGVERMRITSSGNIGICSGGSSLPKKLNVVGVIGNTPS